MTEKLASIVEFFISVGGISACLFIVNQQAKTQPNKSIMGMDIKTFNKLGYVAIAGFTIMLVVALMK